jgi:hypothetical protein
VSLVIAVTALGATGCVAAPQVFTSGGGASISQTGSTSTCPATMDTNQDPPPGFNTETGRSLVDPSTTQVLVCRYPSTLVWQVETWQLDAKGVLSENRSTTLVTQVNDAPAANPLMRCPGSTRKELWFFETGTAVTAKFWVQLDGCGVASDSTHAVFWGHGDPLTS